VDVHDLAVDASGRLVFVATLFGCLATLSTRYSFTPLSPVQRPGGRTERWILGTILPTRQRTNSL
jgi:hypothetical protein